MGSTPGGSCSPVGTSPSMVSCHGQDWNLEFVDDVTGVQAREDCRAGATYILKSMLIGNMKQGPERVGDGVQ